MASMFRALYDGICTSCGADFWEDDLIGYREDNLVCDGCWNEADLEETRETMRLAGTEPGPLPGGIAKPFLAGAKVCPSCHLIQPCDCEPPAMNTNSYALQMEPALAAIIADAQAKVQRSGSLIELEPAPAAPAVDPALQAIIDAAQAKLTAPAPAAEPPLPPELQAVIDAARAQVEAESTADSTPPSVVDVPVESTTDSTGITGMDSTVEARQGEYILQALGLTQHAADGALEAALDALAPYAGPVTHKDVERFIEGVKDFLVETIDNHPRSQQITIGPSEIGIECDHCLAAKLAGWRERREGAWLPTVGTAVHEWLERKVIEAMVGKLAQERNWLTELTVFCGYINGTEIWGHVDLVDVMAGILLDWKITGVTTLKEVARTGEPSWVYRVQRQIYMHGLNQMGIRITHAVNAYLPRNSPSLNDAEWPHEPYDPAIAEAALARADRMARELEQYAATMGTGARDAYISLLPRQRGKDGKISCYSCKRYDDFPAEAERPALDPTFGGLVD